MRGWLYRWVAILAVSMGSLSAAEDADALMYAKFLQASRPLTGLSRHTASLEDNLTMVYLDNHLSHHPTLVFIHGFGAQKEVWLPIALPLRSRYRLILPDLIGDGESSKPMDGDYAIETQAARLHRLLGSIGVTRPILVGNSMGGAISTVYAARYPTAGLILIDPLGLETEPSWLQRQGYRQAQDLFVHICNASEARRYIHAIFSNPPWIPDAVYDYMARQRCRFSSLERHKASYLYRPGGGWVFGRRFARYARTVHVPTLILWGADDRILSPRNAQAFARLIPHAHVVILPDTGHAPMLESPRQTLRHIRTYLHDLPR